MSQTESQCEILCRTLAIRPQQREATGVIQGLRTKAGQATGLGRDTFALIKKTASCETAESPKDPREKSVVGVCEVQRTAMLDLHVPVKTELSGSPSLFLLFAFHPWRCQKGGWQMGEEE